MQVLAFPDRLVVEDLGVFGVSQIEIRSEGSPSPNNRKDPQLNTQHPTATQIKQWKDLDVSGWKTAKKSLFEEWWQTDVCGAASLVFAASSVHRSGPGRHSGFAWVLPFGGFGCGIVVAMGAGCPCLTWCSHVVLAPVFSRSL